MEWKSCENQRMWRALRSGKLHIHMAILREAVLNEDWSAVGRIIGRLPAIKHNTRVRSKAIRSKLFTALRHNTIALGPYLTTLFCVGFQRFMQHNLDPRITTRSAVEFMLRLVEADYSVDNSTVFRAYHALFMYNVWRTSETTIENELLRISDKLSGTVKEVPVGEERVFLDAAIHFLTSLGLPDLLFDIVCDCCTKNPFLVGHCFKMLNVLGNKEIARRVIGEFSDVSVLSPSDPILVDWIQIRLMDLELFDIDAEFFKTAAEMLCNFLDYGENRSVERAWLLLSACVRRINDTSFISSLWSERRTWWPQFHIDCLPQSADECRSEIMKIFEAAVAIR
uniref:Pentatricopeptide repeat-containing protein n=1 Tax=Syphacia muris TaxID=451379 RepID=A0A0N5ARZ2_9BILA